MDKNFIETNSERLLEKSRDDSESRSSGQLGGDSTTELPNMIHSVDLFETPIVALSIDGRLRLCLAQISSTLLKSFSYNEIHNRRVALGINCVQCTPVQLELLRRAGAMPISSRRCGMITKREAERLVKSFLCESKPPALPEDFAFQVQHMCAWGCRGRFLPSRYNSSRAKCIQCLHCQQYFSPNKFIFHSHKLPDSTFSPADAANFNSWRRHVQLHATDNLPDNIVHAWEDVKAMFNGGSRRRVLTPSSPTKTTSRKPVRHVQPDQEPPASASLRALIPKVSPLLLPHSAPLNPNSFYPPSFLHPAAGGGMFPYEWLYRQPALSPYNLWMQRALQAQPRSGGDLWPSWYHHPEGSSTDRKHNESSKDHNEQSK